MLGAIPLERIQLLKRLQTGFRTFLLSNTNAIHVPRFDGIIQSVSKGDSLRSFFEVAYFSNEVKMRKPDKEIFQFVLEQNQLTAEHTLFLDDNVDNLKGAASAGIQTFHVTHPQLVLSLFA
jgi:putative hydrolase of the HAD superfamily